jgi:hypothetical protein
MHFPFPCQALATGLPKTIKLVWQMTPFAPVLVYPLSHESRKPMTAHPLSFPTTARQKRTETIRRKAHHRCKPLSENMGFHHKTPSC